MPEEGICLKQHSELLSFEEITEVVKIGAEMGISKIRLTGGEPLVRKGIPDLIDMISKIDGIRDIGLTTNGVLLPKFARDLKSAGLKRVNISLDTINAGKFKEITRVGNINDVFEGINAAIEAGLYPVKINFVRMPGKNEVDEYQVKEFCERKGLEMRVIRQMNLMTGEYYPVEGGQGGICSVCNRLRLTADGYIIPCLHSDYGFSIRNFGIKDAFSNALNVKPLKGEGALSHEFYNIGG